MESIKKGNLYIVATPIGNLEDITLRALETLKACDYLYVEKSTVSRKLLARYNIDKKVFLYQEQNRDRQIEKIISLINDGFNVALISDAGTPCISDPGYELVNAALENEIKVIPIPGPSSLTAAIAASGVNMKRFIFEGFLPKKKNRSTTLKSFQDEKRAIVMFESPNRLIKTLNDLNSVLGDVEVVVLRELTKIYESIVRGKISEVIDFYSKKNVKGEIVLIVKPNEAKRVRKNKYE